MPFETYDRAALLAAVLLFFFIGMVWPTWRVWRRTGINPITFDRNADDAHAFIGTVMKLVLAALLAWGVAYAWGGPEPLGVWTAPAAVRAAGALLMGVGLVVMLVAQGQMGDSWRIGVDEERTALVTRGLFTVVRNPVFSSMLAMLAGLVLVTPSPWTTCGWLFVATLVGIQARLEEAHLRRMHGEAYRAYSGRVGRFVPGFGTL